MKYISINLYRKIIECAIEEGMSKEDFIDLPTSIDSIHLIKAVPADHFFGLHELLDEKLGPGFAIRVGQKMEIEDYGVLGLSWRTCSWAGEIFERSERYFKLLSNTYFFKVEREGIFSHVFLLREPHRRGVELSNEATISATTVVLKAMTETNLSPTQVTFKHAAPIDLSSYEKAFNCKILFNGPDYSITYRTADLEKRTAKADLSINRFLVDRVEEETRGIEFSIGKISTDVEILIKNALPSGIPALSQIANHIGMSSRTLNRRLSERGITFRELVQKSQEEVAKDLLKNSNRSIGEIAYETGFSEQSTFNRAFKRWVGCSPSEFKNK
ncbi:AraC family transcriptional regulator [Algoriphagus formosus]|uniref:AraC family transcriptional regulator n=1 Tax=Algoriphagus formosus TaxID=2007308 RepID=UPI0012FD8208|nr:AraC family transcriptional regulator [Algoriphagus formosus]